MRSVSILAVITFTFFILGSCNGQESSSQAESGDLEENEVVVTVDGEQWSTTNVRLAGNDVFGMSGGSQGTFGISIDTGYNAEEGSFTNNCEYFTTDPQGNDNEWADEECSIEITTLSEAEVHGNFNFSGMSEDGSKKSVSGIFRVKKMGM